MGRRGPQPQPTKLKMLRGNVGHRKANRSEPKPNPSMPRPPESLDGIALGKWHELGTQLNRLGLLTTADSDALCMYCKVWATWLDAVEHLVSETPVTTVYNANGSVKFSGPSAYHSVAATAFNQLTKLQDRFGLTPSARTGLSIQERHTDELTKFLGNG